MHVYRVIFPRGSEDATIFAVIEAVKLIVLLDCAQTLP